MTAGLLILLAAFQSDAGQLKGRIREYKWRIRSPEFATRWLLGPKQHAEIIDLLEPQRRDIQ